MKSYYEMLDVAPTAPADEIKRAFRREIARYHPDKVQHLGREFQEIAAIKAAELTQAYKTLSDDTLRAEYNAQLESGVPSPAGYRAPASAPQTAPPAAQGEPSARPAQHRASAPEPEPSSSGGATFSQDRAGVSDLVRKATLIRFRHALDGEFGRCEEVPVRGFDVACVPPKAGFWSKLPPRVLARFVAQVDAAVVAESWAMASRMKKDDQRDLCVFVMGPVVASAGELARAIAEERRKPRRAGSRLIMVPVNTRTWLAHVPNDAPPVVKSLLTRLRSA